VYIYANIPTQHKKVLRGVIPSNPLPLTQTTQIHSLVFHYASDVGKLSPSSTRDLHISCAEETLNRESGWKALAGTTGFSHIVALAAAYDSLTATTNTNKDGDENDDDDDDEPRRRCRLAYDVLVDRVAAHVGSYYVALGGAVDALVFAGGIGERCAPAWWGAPHVWALPSTRRATVVTAARRSRRMAWCVTWVRRARRTVFSSAAPMSSSRWRSCVRRTRSCGSRSVRGGKWFGGRGGWCW
jgi:hypothetical protein